MIRNQEETDQHNSNLSDVHHHSSQRAEIYDLLDQDSNNALELNYDHQLREHIESPIQDNFLLKNFGFFQLYHDHFVLESLNL